MSFRLKIRTLGGTKAYKDAFSSRYGALEEAATEAMDKVGDQIKTSARASIAAAGFGRKWQNALRVQRYPIREDSLSAAVDIRSKVPYADIFESGGRVAGKPWLYVPAKGVPRTKCRFTVTPAFFDKKIAKLTAINVGGRPLLVADYKGRGRRPKDGKKVVVFIGIKQSIHRKKFDVIGAVRRGEDNFARFYTAALNGKN